MDDSNLSIADILYMENQFHASSEISNHNHLTINDHFFESNSDSQPIPLQILDTGLPKNYQLTNIPCCSSIWQPPKINV